ncbi:MAG: triose-phosphate isomerase [Solirubrobacterales bacterium]
MPDRIPLVAGNWKMQKTAPEAVQLAEALLPLIEGRGETEVTLCPPFTALRAVADAIEGHGIGLAGQNMHEEAAGAFTGEVSAPMLLDAGADAVILGHSERRQLFGETDEALARKLPAALEAGLRPILCVGETEGERDAERTEAVLRRQLEADLAQLPDGRLAEVVVAYEPVWAIGTGKTATAEIAQEACAFVRAVLSEHDSDAAAGVRILYGGSMKPDNAAELLSRPDIDGGLIGGASLEADQFAAIVLAAGK